MTVTTQRPLTTPSPPPTGPPVLPPDITAVNARRRKRRLRLLLISIVPVIAVLIVAVKLISLSVVTGSAMSQYNAGSFDASAKTSGSLLEQNFFEPWIPYFNRGVALASQEKYVRAIDDLERALELAPADRACSVSVNLALGWERLADGYAAAGSYSGATLLYQTARDVLTAAGPDCAPPQQPIDGRDPSQERDSAEGRVEEKLRQSQDAKQQQDAASGDPTDTQGKLDELKEQSDEAAGQKADGDTRGRGNDGSSGFTDKPW